MRYEELKRRCGNALQDAIETADDNMEAAIRGIIKSLESGPLAPGDVVVTADYARRIDCTFGTLATVLSCWQDDATGRWWAAVRDEARSVGVADADWFSKIDAESSAITEQPARSSNALS